MGSEHSGPGEPASRPQGSQPELLDAMKALRRRARAARHAYWFPLSLFGVLTFASIPFYRQPTLRSAPGGLSAATAGRAPGLWSAFLGGSPGMVQRYLGYYWLAALLGGLLLTQLWYRWHARRAGLATPALGPLISTAVLTVAAIAIPPLSGLHRLRFLQVLWPGDLVLRGTFPFLIIAVGLLALSWVERSLALTVTATAYTAAALLASLYDIGNLTGRLGWDPPAAEPALPNVLLPGLVLLAGGAVAFAVHRRRRAAP